MKFNIIHIEATDLPDAWFSTIYKCLEVGRDFTIDKGSYEGQKRLEFDYITIHIRYPNTLPLLPSIPANYNIPNPVSDSYLTDYIPYLLTGEVKKGESYTYGSRICKAVISNEFNKKIHRSDISNKEKLKKIFLNYYFEESDYIINYWYVNQIEYIIHRYKTEGYRTNQCTLQIAQSSDIILNDPPCLRHIDTRIQDGKLHFFPYFRSWDLWGGMPANLAAIVTLQEYMASEIGVEVGEIIASSKGLHLYDYTWQLAEIIRGKTIQQFKEGK